MTALIFYGAVIEPGRLTVTTVAIREGRLAQILTGRKVVLLSDLHFNDGGEPIAAAALRRLKEIRPDLILLAGDYVDWGNHAPAYERALAFLAQLQAPLGVVAVLGDADRTFSRKSCEFCHQPDSGAPTGRHSVVFLKDAQQLIPTSLGEFRIIGVDSERGTHLTGQVRLLLDSDLPALLLSHTSEIYNKVSSTREVLVLSGDTHGGQVLLPAWFWRLTRRKPDPAHIHGFFHEGKKALFVTRGLGTSVVRFRLGAPPEIVVLEFNGRKIPRANPLDPPLSQGEEVRYSSKGAK
ncbi:MAG: metallophosphoesterase [Candidatus Geothermincolia bacterium]